MSTSPSGPAAPARRVVRRAGRALTGRGPVGQVASAVRLWRLWLHMALTELAMQYRRSVLGPNWITLNMLILIAALGVLYSTLFRTDIRTYLPYLASGLLAWNLITAIVNEGTGVFVANGAAIKNTNMPLPLYVLKHMCRQMLVFLHHVVVMIPIYVLFPEYFSVRLLLILPALVVYCAAGLGVATLVGMLCSRFRDIPNIVTSFMQVCFFVTPIFWPASAVNRPLVVQGNVFYHYVQLLRAPMLGEMPTETNWLVAIGVAVASLVFSFIAFRRYAARIVYTV